MPNYKFYKNSVVKPKLIPRPRAVSVGIPPSCDHCQLNVEYHNGKTKSLKLSKQVAEVLIALGFIVDQ